MSPDDSPLCDSTDRQMSLAFKLKWRANANILNDVYAIKSVSRLKKQGDSQWCFTSIAPSLPVFQFLFCMSACMNEVKKHRVVGWFIHVVPGRIAPPLPHLAWFSILSTGLRRPGSVGGPDILLINCPRLWLVDRHKLPCSTFHVYSLKKKKKTSKLLRTVMSCQTYEASAPVASTFCLDFTLTEA